MFVFGAVVIDNIFNSWYTNCFEWHGLCQGCGCRNMWELRFNGPQAGGATHIWWQSHTSHCAPVSFISDFFSLLCKKSIVILAIMAVWSFQFANRNSSVATLHMLWKTWQSCPEISRYQSYFPEWYWLNLHQDDSLVAVLPFFEWYSVVLTLWIRKSIFALVQNGFV